MVKEYMKDHTLRNWINIITDIGIESSDTAATGKLLDLVRDIKKHERDNMAIWWCVDDVRGQDNGENNLTDKECRDVLDYIKNTHDCCYGITWEHIDNAIDRIVKERELWQS